MKSTPEKINWKRIRVDLLHKSVPVPAPVFFLIFFLIGWACFTLYFRGLRNSRAVETLQHRVETLESQLNSADSNQQDGPPEEEGEAETPTQILEI